LSGKSHQKEFGDARKLLNEVSHLSNHEVVVIRGRVDDFPLYINKTC